jgi:hypothetical protein
VVERIAQLERSGAVPEAASVSTRSVGRSPAATRRTQLVTARREQGGLYLSWPLLIGGAIGTVLLSLLGAIWALGGFSDPAPPPVLRMPPRRPPAVSQPAPPPQVAPPPQAAPPQAAPPSEEPERPAPGAKPKRRRHR